mmetsp:Transcript_36498/g.74161  ORF Transcript_36498/g.74161 Transcript_36498/m.74161 type:complete len:87 (-) Transcript_36498:119-379(-)
MWGDSKHALAMVRRRLWYRCVHAPPTTPTTRHGMLAEGGQGGGGGSGTASPPKCVHVAALPVAGSALAASAAHLNPNQREKPTRFE